MPCSTELRFGAALCYTLFAISRVFGVDPVVLRDAITELQLFWWFHIPEGLSSTSDQWVRFESAAVAVLRCFTTTEKERQSKIHKIWLGLEHVQNRWKWQDLMDLKDKLGYGPLDAEAAAQACKAVEHLLAKNQLEVLALSCCLYRFAGQPLNYFCCVAAAVSHWSLPLHSRGT